MPTCKNCLHVELCKEDLLNSMKGLGLSNEQEIIEIGLNSQNNDCEFFKDRSKFIELPCKNGDIVYQIIPVGAFAKGGWKIEELTIEKIYLRTGIIFSQEHMWRDMQKLFVIDTNGIAFDCEAIGKHIFFTREEAEQAIKERNYV